MLDVFCLSEAEVLKIGHATSPPIDRKYQAQNKTTSLLPLTDFYYKLSCDVCIYECVYAAFATTTILQHKQQSADITSISTASTQHLLYNTTVTTQLLPTLHTRASPISSMLHGAHCTASLTSTMLCPPRQQRRATTAVTAQHLLPSLLYVCYCHNAESTIVANAQHPLLLYVYYCHNA
jgi:hypothetical protein